MNDLTKKHDKRIIWIHWLSAALILTMIPTGKILRDTVVSSTKLLLYQWHITCGVLVFAMTIYRSYLFFTAKRPPRLETGWFVHNNIIVWVQRLFYIALWILGISGLATIFMADIISPVLQNNWQKLPATVDVEIFDAHEFAGNLMIGLLIAHIGGVVLHYFRFKENVLKRIS